MTALWTWDTIPPGHLIALASAYDDPGPRAIVVLCVAFVAWVAFVAYLIAATLVVDEELEQ